MSHRTSLFVTSLLLFGLVAAPANATHIRPDIYSHSHAEAPDSVIAVADGWAQPGETMALSVTVQNVDTAAWDISVSISTTDPFAEVVPGYDTVSLGSVAGLGYAVTPYGSLRVRIRQDAPCGRRIPVLIRAWLPLSSSNESFEPHGIVIGNPNGAVPVRHGPLSLESMGLFTGDVAWRTTGEVQFAAVDQTGGTLKLLVYGLEGGLRQAVTVATADLATAHVARGLDGWGVTYYRSGDAYFRKVPDIGAPLPEILLRNRTATNGGGPLITFDAVIGWAMVYADSSAGTTTWYARRVSPAGTASSVEIPTGVSGPDFSITEEALLDAASGGTAPDRWSYVTFFHGSGSQLRARPIYFYEPASAGSPGSWTTYLVDDVAAAPAIGMRAFDVQGATSTGGASYPNQYNDVCYRVQAINNTAAIHCKRVDTASWTAGARLAVFSSPGPYDFVTYGVSPRAVDGQLSVGWFLNDSSSQTTIRSVDVNLVPPSVGTPVAVSGSAPFAAQLLGNRFSHRWINGRIVDVATTTNDPDDFNWFSWQAFGDEWTLEAPSFRSETALTAGGTSFYSEIAAADGRVGAFSFTNAESGYGFRLYDSSGSLLAPPLAVDTTSPGGGYLDLAIASDGTDFLLMWLAQDGSEFRTRLVSGVTGTFLGAQQAIPLVGTVEAIVRIDLAWTGARYRFVLGDKTGTTISTVTGTILADGSYEPANRVPLWTFSWGGGSTAESGSPKVACTGTDRCLVASGQQIRAQNAAPASWAGAWGLGTNVLALGSDGGNYLALGANGTTYRRQLAGDAKSSAPLPVVSFSGGDAPADLHFTGEGYLLTWDFGAIPMAIPLDPDGIPRVGLVPYGMVPMAERLSPYSLGLVRGTALLPNGDLAYVFQRYDAPDISDSYFTRLSIPDGVLLDCDVVANTPPSVALPVAPTDLYIVTTGGAPPRELTDGITPGLATFSGDSPACLDVDFGAKIASAGWDIDDDGTIDFAVTDADSDGVLSQAESTVDVTSDELIALGYGTETLAGPGVARLVVTDQFGATGFASSPIVVHDQVSPTVELSVPNGGEAWPGGSTRTIAWSADDNVGLSGFDLSISLLDPTEFVFSPDATTFPVALPSGSAQDFLFTLPAYFAIQDVSLDIDLVWAGTSATAAIELTNVDSGTTVVLQQGGTPLANVARIVGNYDRTLATFASLDPFDSEFAGLTWRVRITDPADGVAATLESLVLRIVGEPNVIFPIVSGLPADARSYDWTLPTLTSPRTFVTVTAFDAAIPANATDDSSDGSFFVTQANGDQVRTLVVWNEARMRARYGEGAIDELEPKLFGFAAHPKVDGLVVDLSSGEATAAGIGAALAAWDAFAWNDATTSDNAANAAAATAAANAIRTYLYGLVSAGFPNLETIVLVGGDPLLPFFRLDDTTLRHPESNYIAELASFGFAVNCTTTQSPTWATVCSDRYLSDAPYGASATNPVPGSPLSWWLPDVAVGRLVETPAQISGLLDTFTAQDGVTVVDRVMTTGYDFLTDGGDECQSLFAAQLEPSATAFVRLSEAVSPWTDTDLKDRLFGLGGQVAADLTVVSGHADHRAEGAAAAGAAGVLETVEMESGTAAVPGASVVGLGCHTGLAVTPDGAPGDPLNVDTAFQLDLAELLATRRFPAFVGNSGFGWGLAEGLGLGERLLLHVADEIARAGQIPLGEALRLAKQEYFLRQSRVDSYDHKVIHESTFYGIPNYEVRVTRDTSLTEQPDSWVGSAANRTELLAAKLKGPRIPGTDWLGDASWSEKSAGGRILTKSAPLDVASPAGPASASLRVMEFSYQAYQKGQDTDGNPATEDWEEAYVGHRACVDGGGLSVPCTGVGGGPGPGQFDAGRWFSLDGLASGEGGQPIQPMISFDSHLFGTQQHGVLMRGGEFVQPTKINPVACTNHLAQPLRCFDPVIGNPETKQDLPEGPAPAPFLSMGRPTPFLSMGRPTPNGFVENALTTNSPSARWDHLNAPMGETVRRGHTGGAPDREIFAEWIYRTREFTQFYSNSTDWTAPTFGAFTGDCSTDIAGNDCFSSLAGLTMTFDVPVTDETNPPGVYKVYVTWSSDVDSAFEGAWSTFELAPDGTGHWRGTLGILRTTHYLVQAVDWSGNVGTVLVSGSDVGADATPMGSTWSLPRLHSAEVPDGDGDGLADWIEQNTPGLNPALADSDGDGLADAVDDLDHDGLTNIRELELGYDPADADIDDDGDNDGSERNNGKLPTAAGDGDRLAVSLASAGADVAVSWPRATNTGLANGTPCWPIQAGCSAVADNNAIDGYFRVYVSDDPRFSMDDFRAGPDDCLNPPQSACGARADDLDVIDRRAYLVTNAELPGPLQGAPILYYQVINWDIDRPAPLIETVVRATNRFTIYGQSFDPAGAQPKLCESATTCASPISMTIVPPTATNRTSTRIQADAPIGTTGTRFVAVENPDGLRHIYTVPYSF